MPFVSKGMSNANAEGWLRDSKYYWNEILQRHPEAFSLFNKSIIDGKHPILSGICGKDSKCAELLEKF